MEFAINRDVFLKSLGHANGIIERKTTLPILSNILIEAKNNTLILSSTDMDISIIEKIQGSEPFIQSGGSVTNSIYLLSQLGGTGYLSFLISDDEHGK